MGTPLVLFEGVERPPLEGPGQQPSPATAGTTDFRPLFSYPYLWGEKWIAELTGDFGIVAEQFGRLAMRLR